MSPLASHLVTTAPIWLSLLAFAVRGGRPGPRCRQCNGTQQRAVIDFASGEGQIIPCVCVREPRPTIPVRAVDPYRRGDDR